MPFPATGTGRGAEPAEDPGGTNGPRHDARRREEGRHDSGTTATPRDGGAAALGDRGDRRRGDAADLPGERRGAGHRDDHRAEFLRRRQHAAALRAVPGHRLGRDGLRPARIGAAGRHRSTFTVEVGDETTFTIEEETPPACGIAPEPQTVGPLEDGEELSVDFATAFLADCDLGSISLYHFDCPAGTDADATDYAAFSGACAEPIDGTTFAIREAEGDQNWDVVTGAYGIAGRAPLVGLVPGDYRVAEQDGGDRTSVAFCFGFAGTPATPAEPELVLQETLGEGGLTLSVDGNRIACDVFSAAGGRGGRGGNAGRGRAG